MNANTYIDVGVDVDVESLSDILKNTNIGIINQTPYNLQYINGTVISKTVILPNTYLGNIEGEIHFLYDITNYDNLFHVDDDMVVDVSKIYPRTILSYIQYGDHKGIPGNCKVNVEIDYETGEAIISIYTTKMIYQGEELSLSSEC